MNENFIKLMKEKGITQAALARKVGKTPEFINLIKMRKQNIRKVQYETVEKIAKELGVPIDYLGKKDSATS